MANVQEEIWKDIPGYEGRYEVSSLGRVRSLRQANSHGGGTKIRNIPLLRKIQVNTSGYLDLALQKNKKQYTVSIHRLIAMAFIPNPQRLPEVNHIDGNKFNNSIENLEWVSSRNNQLHAYRTGLKRKLKHEQNPKAILNREQVLEIFNSALTQRQLSEKYSVSMACINNVKNGYAWCEITGINKLKPKCIV